MNVRGWPGGEGFTIYRTGDALTIKTEAGPRKRYELVVLLNDECSIPRLREKAAVT